MHTLALEKEATTEALKAPLPESLSPSVAYVNE
jgi:hypothetical protein